MTHILGKLDIHPHLIRQALKLSLVVICNNSITSFENSSLYFKQRYIQDILDEYLCTFWNLSVFWWCYLQTSFAFGRQPPIDTGRVLVLYSSLYCTVLLWMKLYGEKLPTQRVTAALHYNYIQEVPWFYASKFKRTVICIISKMFQMTFLFIFTPQAWLHIIIFFCFDSTTDGSFTQAFWCQQASSSDINSSFITCTIEFIFWTTSWQTPPGPPRIWTSPLLSISFPLIKTIFDTMFRIKWRNVFARVVACMVILRSTVNHVSNVFSIVIVIVSTLMSVIMPTLPVFNIL